MSNDTLIGGLGDDTIDGGQGNDRLFGLADNDSILGGTGSDSLYGDGGDDILRGGSGYDLLVGGTGNDTFESGEGGDYLNGGDTIYGGEGLDIAIYAGDLADYQWSQIEFIDGYGNFVSYWSVYNSLTYENDELRNVEVLRFNDGEVVILDTSVSVDPPPTITGTDDPVSGDTLYGTQIADVVTALRGNDYVIASEGTDLVIAGLGNDTVEGGEGNDELRGEGGDDLLFGNDGDDLLLGGDESDTLRGGAGNDKLYGGDARTIYGQHLPSNGANYLYGDDGNDELYGGGGDDHLDPGPGDDTVDGGVADYQASDSHWNYLYYEYGYANTAAGVYVNLASGTATDPDGGHDMLHNINYVYGTANDDTLIGNDRQDQYQNINTYLYGRGGDDTLEGRSGKAWLEGGEGNDTMTLGNGGGYLIGGLGNDVLKGGTGFDTAAFWDYYGPSGQGLTITLLAPGTGLNYQVVNDANGGIDKLYDNIEGLSGSSFNDILSGNSAANELFGSHGDDTITGFGGNDRIYGGFGIDIAVYAGNIAGYQISKTYSEVVNFIGYAVWQVKDIYLADGDDGTDSVWSESGEGGTELLQFADDTFVITALPDGTPGGDLLYGGSSPDTLDGGLGSDQIYAGGGDDSVHGGDGDDVLYGEDGNDFLEGDDGNDVIYGGAGNDYIIGDSGLGDDKLYGEEGNDTLIGHAGKDLLDGGVGDDSLEGGEGDDTLIGGFGNDTLVGGDANDTAVFSGVKNGYLVELFADGRTRVIDINITDGDDGTDVLEGVEKLQFAPDLNQPPTAVVLTNVTASLAENTSTASHIKVAEIAITDDALGSNTISLLGADAAAFEVIGTALYLKAGTSLDYEIKTAYGVTLSVSDSTLDGSSAVSTDYSLAVSDVNEAPTALALSATAFNENIPAGSLVADLSSSDPDSPPQSFTYALAAGAGDTDNLAFFISGNQLRITESPDYEVKSSYGIRLKTTDQGGLSFERNVILSVNDLPDSPAYSFSSSAAFIYEGGALALAVRSANASPGTRIYWSFSGTGITSADFNDGSLSGTNTLGADGGAGFTKTIAADSVVEGDEGLEVKFFSDSARTQQLGSTILVTIKEPSVGVVTDGPDIITGTAADETIRGVPTGSILRGKGTVDKLTGGGGDDSFVLGDASGVFYDDSNLAVPETKDMAWITDFSVGDKIILFGSAANYQLTSARYNGFKGVQINALLPASTPEPIGFVQAATLATLNLSNPNQFTYS